MSEKKKLVLLGLSGLLLGLFSGEPIVTSLNLY